MKRLELRNVPAADVAHYLLTFFDGATQPDGAITGEGWHVRFEDGEPIIFKPATRVPVLFIHITGPRTDETAAFIIRKTMRGGG